MKLYCSKIGPGPRRTTLYIAVKGIRDIEVEFLDTSLGQTRTPEFLAKNPAGRIPLLETDDGNFLAESQAIMQYLEEIYPIPPMRGKTEAERRRVDLQSGLITEFFHYCFMSVSHLSAYVSRGLVQAHDVDIVTRPLWWTRLSQISDLMGSDPYLAGESPTIPDLMLFPMVEYTRAMYDFFIPPHLRPMYRWYDRVRSLPGITPLEFPENHHEKYIARYGTRC